MKHHHPLPPEQLDPDAMKIVHRLVQHGFETYLVGGCVRDLLLGEIPKDFDVATAAKPSDMKRIFRNCRLIGRRFRLAHLHFRDGKIVEVATFRREPNETDDLTGTHASGNLFGTVADDAIRRDFTINALMYDVKRQQILDWTDGMADIESRTIRSIGHPQRRILEDPVRILRAIKFAARLDLTIEPTLVEVCECNAAMLSHCSPARLVEEILKILRSGHASACLDMLQEIGALSQLLPHMPPVNTPANQRLFELLDITDQRIRRNGPPEDTLLIAILLYSACEDLIWQDGDMSATLSEQLEHVAAPMHFTRRHMGIVRNIFASLRRISSGPRTARLRKILLREYAADAISMLALSGRVSRDIIHRWENALRGESPVQEKQASSPSDDTPSVHSAPPRKRRRRPKSRKAPQQPPNDNSPDSEGSNPSI